jgi:AAA+ ATPase superfamily predicted ATPase
MFETSLPAVADAFHDRRTEIEQLLRIVQRLQSGSPAWLAILGPRKIGKTSLLLEVANRTRTPVVFVVLDSFEELPVSVGIFRRYALRLLDRSLGPELGTSLEALAPRPAAFREALQHSPRFAKLPPSLRAFILELPELPMNSDAIRGCLELPEQIAGALELKVLVAWDEFQELAGGRGAHPLPLVRSVWQRHRRVGYVISGSARSMLTDLTSSEHSPFFQHFTVMELGPFPTEEAIQLLVTRAPIPRSLAEEAVRAIGGHPFYLQLLGETLTEKPPPYDEGALKEALQQLLFSRTGRLALYFEREHQRLVGRATTLAATLQALADGCHRISDISRATSAPTGSTVRYLERLGDAVARTKEGHYRLDDPTFGLWLRWRQPGGTVVPMKLLGDEAELAAAEHLATMGFDLIYQSRASRGAFDLLAIRGPRQLGVQVKRTDLPLRLPGKAWARMEAEAERFHWHWVVAAVTPGSVVLLDPARAKRSGTSMRLDAAASIDNLLLWLDRRSSR